MTPDNIALSTLSALSLAGLVALTLGRIRRNGLHRLVARRWLLIDILLVILAAEVLLDTLVESNGPSDLSTAVHLVAVSMRGASVAGVLTLLWTFPHAVRDESAVVVDRRSGRDRRTRTARQQG